MNRGVWISLTGTPAFLCSPQRSAEDLSVTLSLKGWGRASQARVFPCEMPRSPLPLNTADLTGFFKEKSMNVRLSGLGRTHGPPLAREHREHAKPQASRQTFIRRITRKARALTAALSGKITVISPAGKSACISLPRIFSPRYVPVSLYGGSCSARQLPWIYSV